MGEVYTFWNQQFRKVPDRLSLESIYLCAWRISIYFTQRITLLSIAY